MAKKTESEYLNQRQFVSAAKLRVRGIGKEIRDLKRERFTLEQFIMQGEHIARVWKQDKNKNIKAKLKHGQENKKDKLKAALGGVRAT